MSDRRPSENQDDKLFAAAAEYGRTHLGWTADDTEPDPIEDLLERAQNANDPVLGLMFAHVATVRAIQAQTEELHLANLIAWQIGTAENYEREIREGLNR